METTEKSEKENTNTDIEKGLRNIIDGERTGTVKGNRKMEKSYPWPMLHRECYRHTSSTE